VKNNISGFTLIELSIVLIIISLIVGGIVGGKSLIHSAELNSVIRDVNNFKAVINTFNDSYDAWPGDMVDATTYWPAPVVTVNGDGNNQIEWATERLTSWQHLSLSEILPQYYSGQQVGGDSATPGVNIPASSLNQAGFRFYYDTRYGRSGNRVQITGKNGTSFNGAALSPKDAVTIDKKMDDGKSSSGQVVAVNGSGVTNCIVSNNYVLSEEDVRCKMTFWVE